MLAGAADAGALELGQAAQQVVEATNVFRNAQGLEPTSVASELEAAARDFAAYMARTGKYGHRADGRRPSERAAAHGYKYCIVSENIAYQFRSRGFESAAVLAQELVEGWKDSPEHRRNMLDAAVTQTGVGIAQGEAGRYFAVQMFGRPKKAAIRFSVRNSSAEKVAYRAGERRFFLPPRASRTHTVCRPTQVSIDVPGAAEPFRAQAGHGERYIVTAGGVVKRPL